MALYCWPACQATGQDRAVVCSSEGSWRVWPGHPRCSRSVSPLIVTSAFRSWSSDHPALLCHSLTTGPFDWISGKIPASVKLDGKGKVCDVMIRHRMEAVKAKIMLLEDAKRYVLSKYVLRRG